MISAREVGTATTWNIRELEELESRSPGAWDQLKANTLWECLECGRHAYPRRRSKDGRAATWVARHREEPECGLKSRTVSSEPGGVDHNREPVSNAGTVLRLLFEYGTNAGQRSEIHADGSDAGSTGRTGSGHWDGESRSTREKTQRLSAMLGHLLTDPELVRGMGENRIVVPERGEVRPKDLIWRFDELDPSNPDLMAKHVVVWGPVRTANARFDQDKGTGSGYLNQGLYRESKGAIEVYWSEAMSLIDRYRDKGVTNFEDFAGWYVIAFGQTWGTTDGRVRLVPYDGLSIAMRQAPL